MEFHFPDSFRRVRMTDASLKNFFCMVESSEDIARFNAQTTSGELTDIVMSTSLATWQLSWV